MDLKEILRILKDEIHSVVFATVDDDGLPYTCVIDIMLCGEQSLFFITAKGKSLYERLQKRPFAALSGMKGEDTLSTVAVSLRGHVRNLGSALIPRVFAENPYMADIYRTEESRIALEVFELYAGEGEYFDLSCLPPQRILFQFGGYRSANTEYRITDRCIACGDCIPTCPTGCILPHAAHYYIQSEHCILCGNCYAECSHDAVEKISSGR